MEAAPVQPAPPTPSEQAVQPPAAAAPPTAPLDDVRGAWWDIFPRVLKAAIAFLTHATLAIVLIASISLVEKALSVTDVGSHLIVDILPMRYLFDLIDAAVILIFGFYGLRDLIHELRQ
jgi:hypothetical protein